MSARRYHQYCGVARALDVVGERWALLIVRDLLAGPQRYSDLLHTLEGIPTDMLAARLRSLEAAGIVRRATLPPPAGSKVYELTGRGHALEGAIVELSRWGLDLLGEPADDDVFRADWLALTLRTRFRPDRAAGVTLTAAFEVAGETFHVRVDDGTLHTGVGPADADTADVVVAGDPAALAAVARGEPAAGRLDVTGDPAALTRFAEVFGLAGSATTTETEPGGP